MRVKAAAQVMKQNVLVSGSGWKENKNMVYVTIMGKQRGDVA